MSRFISFISNNALTSTLVGAAILAGTSWGLRKLKDRRDSATIYSFLQNSENVSDLNFRTTSAISANTNLSEDRVAALCSRHPKIRRNEKALQSWTLGER